MGYSLPGGLPLGNSVAGLSFSVVEHLVHEVVEAVTFLQYSLHGGRPLGNSVAGLSFPVVEHLVHEVVEAGTFL